MGFIERLPATLWATGLIAKCLGGTGCVVKTADQRQLSRPELRVFNLRNNAPHGTRFARTPPSQLAEDFLRSLVRAVA